MKFNLFEMVWDLLIFMLPMTLYLVIHLSIGALAFYCLISVWSADSPTTWEISKLIVSGLMLGISYLAHYAVLTYYEIKLTQQKN